MSSDTGSMCWFDGQGTAGDSGSLARSAAPLFVADERDTLQFNGLLLGGGRARLSTSHSCITIHRARCGCRGAQGRVPATYHNHAWAGSPTYLLLSPPMPSDPPRVGCCEMTPVFDPLMLGWKWSHESQNRAACTARVPITPSGHCLEGHLEDVW